MAKVSNGPRESTPLQSSFDPSKLQSATDGFVKPLKLLSTAGKHVVGNLHGVVFHSTSSLDNGTSLAGPRAGTRKRRRGSSTESKGKGVMLSSSRSSGEVETVSRETGVSGRPQKDLLDDLFGFTLPPAPAQQSHGAHSTEAHITDEENQKSVAVDDKKPNFFDTSSSRAPSLLTSEQKLSSVLESGALDERRKLIEKFVAGDVPRWNEAVAVLRTILVALEYEEAQKQIPCDETLADQVWREFEGTTPFVQFLQTFTHICGCPTLQTLPLAMTLRHCVQEWADSRNGIADALAHRSAVKELLELLQAAADAHGAAALSSPQSASEALLLALLTDICRYTMQLACTVIPHENYPFSGTSMDAVMAHNRMVMDNSAEEQENYKKVIKLLNVSRSTAFYRCSEEVQASVSPLIAELMSIFDRFSIDPIEPLDKHKDECVRCRLTGLRLESNSSEDTVHPIGRWYWGHIAKVPIT